MQFAIQIEYDAEGRVYLATVKDVPVFIQARSRKEALKLVKEALQLYFEETKRRRRSPQAARPVNGCTVTVEV